MRYGCCLTHCAMGAAEASPGRRRLWRSVLAAPTGLPGSAGAMMGRTHAGPSLASWCAAGLRPRVGADVSHAAAIPARAAAPCSSRRCTHAAACTTRPDDASVSGRQKISPPCALSHPLLPALHGSTAAPSGASTARYACTRGQAKPVAGVLPLGGCRTAEQKNQWVHIRSGRKGTAPTSPRINGRHSYRHPAIGREHHEAVRADRTAEVEPRRHRQVEPAPGARQRSRSCGCRHCGAMLQRSGCMLHERHRC